MRKISQALLAAAVMAVGCMLTGCPENNGLKDSWIRAIMSDVDSGVTITLNEIYKFKDNSKMSVVRELSAWGADWHATVRWWANGYYSISEGTLLMNFQGVPCQEMGAKLVTTGTVPNQLPGDLSDMLDIQNWQSGWLLEAFEDLTDAAITASYTIDGDTLFITKGQGDPTLFSRFDDNFNYDNPNSTGCD